MESESEGSDIIRPLSKRKRAIISEDEEAGSKSSDIVFPFRKKCRMLDEEDGTDWVWKNKANNNKVWHFSRIPGIEKSTLEVIGQNVTPLQTVNAILTEDFWEIIVTETNRYQKQVMGDETRKIKSFEHKWRETYVDELKAYFALCILMTQVKKSVQSCWSKRSIIQTPIYRETLPLWRFTQLTRFLHFSNNEEADTSDRLNKIRNIIENLNEKFELMYIPEQDLSLDESLMKYKGRLSYKQFNPSKRARFGVKFYKLCESESGYCVKFKIYTGQDVSDSGNSASETVVLTLSSPIAGYGHNLYLDNWFSSPNLYRKLHAKKINVVGTVRCHRKNMPAELAATKLKRFEASSRSCNGILAVKWKDKKDIYVLSTKHAEVEMIETGKRIWIKNKNQDEIFTKPNVILDYNNGMGGVDLQDNYLSSFPLMRKFYKNYKKIFFYLMDMTLFNAFVLFRKLKPISKTRKYSFSKFRLDVAEEILQNVNILEYRTPGSTSASDTPLRLQAKQWAHFPRKIPPTTNKEKPQRRCKVCAKHNKRSETIWKCKKCLVALHLPHCFEVYHTQLNY